MKSRFIYVQFNKFPHWFSIQVGDNSRDQRQKSKIETLLGIQTPQRFFFEKYSQSFVEMQIAEPLMQFNRHDIPLHRLYNYLFVSPYRGDWNYLTK